MRPRHADVLREMGFEGTVEEFRGTLAAVKAELFPGLTDEELCFTRDQAGGYVADWRHPGSPACSCCGP